MLILSTADTSDTIQGVLEHVPNIRQSAAVTLRNQLLVTTPALRVIGTRRLRGVQRRPTQRSPTLDPEGHRKMPYMNGGDYTVRGFLLMLHYHLLV
jgi:hypothetical protein